MPQERWQYCNAAGISIRELPAVRFPHTWLPTEPSRRTGMWTAALERCSGYTDYPSCRLRSIADIWRPASKELMASNGDISSGLDLHSPRTVVGRPGRGSSVPAGVAAKPARTSREPVLMETDESCRATPGRDAPNRLPDILRSLKRLCHNPSAASNRVYVGSEL